MSTKTKQKTILFSPIFCHKFLPAYCFSSLDLTIKDDALDLLGYLGQLAGVLAQMGPSRMKGSTPFFFASLPVNLDVFYK